MISKPYERKNFYFTKAKIVTFAQNDYKLWYQNNLWSSQKDCELQYASENSFSTI